jgi:hypothetical protein
LNVARYVTTVDVAVPHAPTRIRGRLLNDNSTLRAETGIGSTRSEHANNGWSGDFTPIDGDGSLGVVAVARWGFAPPVPGSRVELIVGELIADTTVDLDELATLEFAPETEAVVSSVDQIPADDEPRDEARPDDAQVARDAAADSLDDATPAAPPADGEGDRDDDFWSGAASERSVPTRKVVYGARTTDGGTKRHGWLSSVRRHRR